LLVAGCGRDTASQTTFTAGNAAEAIARVTVDCGTCAWDTTGSEAVVLKLALDSRPSQHLPVVRTGRAEYQVMLGAVAAGRHTVTIEEDAGLTAPNLRGKSAAKFSIEIDQVTPSDAGYHPLSMAPLIHARPNTVGQFTDVPLLMWYEIEPSPTGTRYRYTVVFSNEDGGTPADRLMATWGRTTDIEYVYSVEVDTSGTIVSEDMQGPDHEILAFNGRREGRHPLLWVSTENNMVLDRGEITVRYAPVPALLSLSQVSREAVMDANPWTYEVMSKELRREGKIAADAPPGRGAIPDPRRFAFLEGCGEAGSNALSSSVKVDGAWLSSDRGVPEYRVTRDGCFRMAIPLPGNAAAGDVQAVRVQAFARKDRPPSQSRFTRLNTLFSLNEQFAPGPRVITWEGSAVLEAGGAPFEIPVR
jgi:hypothetical protein